MDLIGSLKVVLEHGPLKIIVCSIMIHKINPKPNKKYPIVDDTEEMDSTEGNFQGESERHSMGGNGEIKCLIWSMMQGFIYLSHKIILSTQGNRAILAKQLESKNVKGRIHGSQHGERKSPWGLVFSRTGPHNCPDEFTRDPPSQSIPIMHKLMDEKRE